MNDERGSTPRAGSQAHRDRKAAGPRWWPLLAVVAVAALFLIWNWLLRDAPSRQDRVMGTVIAGALVLILAVAWLLLLSRLRWRTRLLGVLALGLVGLGLAKSVRVTGFSGDVVPILSWQWSAVADEELARDLPTSAAADAGAAATAATAANDFPQFLGPTRNAVVSGIELAEDWQASPPELVWRQPVGAGWSGFAVAGGVAVTLEQRGPEELVVAYDLASGAVRWSHSEETRFDNPLGGVGPRSTPTIADGLVYAVGATGILNVLELATGGVVWSKNILEDNEAALPQYGVAASPLVHDGRVVLVSGDAPEGSLVAYDRHSGDKLWSAGDGRGRYSSPALATLAGSEQILLFYNGALRGHRPDTGEVLWEHAFPTATEETSQPLPLSDTRVLLSAGYGIGSKVFEISSDDAEGWNATLVWERPTMKAKFTNLVLHDGTIYGLDDGILAAIDPADGSRRWKRGRYGHGHLLLVGELLVVLSEKGEVALVRASPDAYEELGRFQAISGKTWNTPALAGGYLLVRNASEAACFRLPLRN